MADAHKIKAYLHDQNSGNFLFVFAQSVSECRSNDV